MHAHLIPDLPLDIVDGLTRLNIEGDIKSLDKDLHTSRETRHKLQSRLVLDAVVAQSVNILELLSNKDKMLMIRMDAFPILDLIFEGVDGVTWKDIEGDSLSYVSFDEDLHTTNSKVQSRLVLDAVITQRVTILELLSKKDKTLLVRRDAFPILDLSFEGVDGVDWKDIEGDSLSYVSLDEDLQTAKNKVQRRLVLDAVVAQSVIILELLSKKDKILLVQRKALNILDHGLDVVDGDTWIDFEDDNLFCGSFDEDFHTT